MSKIIKITAFFLFFVMCFYVKNVWAVTCLGNQQQCCKNGSLSCCPHAGYDEKGRELSYDISGCTSFEEFERVEDFDITLKPVEFCTKGATQEKYTATGCTYETETRTCCGTNWSGWDEECCSGADCCTSSQCWNGSSCAVKGAVSRICSGNVTNATGGTQTRTATCNSGSGWSYGVWTGTCTCATGYKWTGSSCQKALELNCKITSCPSGQHLVNPGTAQCCCEYDTCGTTQNGQASACRCPKQNDQTIPYGWVDMGTNCRTKFDCGTISLPTCDSSLSGTYYTKWDSSVDGRGCGGQHSDINGEGMCREYLCRQR